MSQGRRVAIEILACVLLVAAGLRAQCPPPGWSVPGMPTSTSLFPVVLAMTTWDPDGAGLSPELLVIGGAFASVGGVSAANIAAWDGVSWQALGGGIAGDVRALTVYNGELIAGGQFTSAGGVSANHIARWNGSTWQPLGPGLLPINALMVYNGELIAGGGLLAGSPNPLFGVARWNGSFWQSVGSGLSSVVNALTVFKGELIAGGSLDITPDFIPVGKVARWSGAATWQPLIAGAAGFDGTTVTALAVHGSNLVVGGDFTHIGTQAFNRIAASNGATWFQLGTGLTPPNSAERPYALAFYGEELIAGGAIVNAGGVAANFVAAFNGSCWHPLAQGIGGSPPSWAYPVVRALAVRGQDLFVGGGFNLAGAVPGDRPRAVVGPPSRHRSGPAGRSRERTRDHEHRAHPGPRVLQHRELRAVRRLPRFRSLRRPVRHRSLLPSLPAELPGRVPPVPLRGAGAHPRRRALLRDAWDDV